MVKIISDIFKESWDSAWGIIKMLIILSIIGIIGIVWVAVALIIDLINYLT